MARGEAEDEGSSGTGRSAYGESDFEVTVSSTAVSLGRLAGQLNE